MLPVVLPGRQVACFSRGRAEIGIVPQSGLSSILANANPDQPVIHTKPGVQTLMTTDVIIIGGGISGTAAAYNLAKRGVKVLLLERDDLASMASGWTLAGVRQSGRHPAELPLAKAAVRIWEHLDEELGVDVEYRQNGNLRLALTDADIPETRAVVDQANAASIEAHYLDGADAVHDVAPALTPDLVGASLCPTDGHANPTLTVRGFADAANRLGAVIETGVHVTALTRTGNRITGVETTRGPIAAGMVIVAAGIYTPQLIAPLGLDLPITVTIVSAVQSTPVPSMLKQVLGVNRGGIAGRQEVSGRFRFTGSSVPWGIDSLHTDETVRPQFGEVSSVINDAIRVLPALEQARLAQVWGGLIDQTPDAIPVYERPAEFEGLVLAAGFSGHGFCLGPVTGEILADLATTGTTSHSIDAFSLGRFASQTGSKEAVQLHG